MVLCKEVDKNSSSCSALHKSTKMLPNVQKSIKCWIQTSAEEHSLSRNNAVTSGHSFFFSGHSTFCVSWENISCNWGLYPLLWNGYMSCHTKTEVKWLWGESRFYLQSDGNRAPCNMTALSFGSFTVLYNASECNIMVYIPQGQGISLSVTGLRLKTTKLWIMEQISEITLILLFISFCWGPNDVLWRQMALI